MYGPASIACSRDWMSNFRISFGIKYSSSMAYLCWFWNERYSSTQNWSSIVQLTIVCISNYIEYYKNANSTSKLWSIECQQYINHFLTNKILIISILLDVWEMHTNDAKYALPLIQISKQWMIDENLVASRGCTYANHLIGHIYGLMILPLKTENIFNDAKPNNIYSCECPFPGTRFSLHDSIRAFFFLSSN